MTEDTALLDEAIKNGLAKRNGPRYYFISDDGKETPLGMSKAEACKSLKALVMVGSPDKKEPASETPAEDLSPEAASTEKDTVIPDLVKSVEVATSNKAADHGYDPQLYELLDELGDINSSAVSTLDIKYKGVSVFNFDDPVIKKLPVVFYWKLRGKDNANITDNGDGKMRCNNWAVFMPKAGGIHTRIFEHLKFSRNDTAKGDYVTNGELVLCVSNKEKYLKHQQDKAISGLVQAKRDKDRRVQSGRNIGKLNEAQAGEHLGNINQRDNQAIRDRDADFARLKSEL